MNRSGGSGGRSRNHFGRAQIIRPSRRLRDALSRSYYSVFHLGCILLGKGFGNHDQFVSELRVRTDDDLAGRVERLRELRIRADYHFDAVRRHYHGSLKEFREQALEGLRLGYTVYDELVSRIDQESRYDSISGE